MCTVKNMGIKKHKPTTPSLRWTQTADFAELTTDTPYKPLLRPIKRTGGRNAYGRITVRHQGGGHKRLYRLIDFKQLKFDQPATVEAIEYDPNRNARILLIKFTDNTYAYILAYKGAEVGHEILSSKKRVPIKPGNRTRLKNIPLGTLIHNLELKPEAGGKLFRAAGAYGIVEAKEGRYVNLRLPSKEKRIVLVDCFASIGAVGNQEFSLVRIGKAGRNRHRGIRPTVRGVAMSPNSHPHGGGEGKSPVGMKSSKTFTGKIARGKRTRKKHKYSDKFIIKRRRK